MVSPWHVVKGGNLLLSGFLPVVQAGQPVSCGNFLQKQVESVAVLEVHKSSLTLSQPKPNSTLRLFEIGTSRSSLFLHKKVVIFVTNIGKLIW